MNKSKTIGFWSGIIILLVLIVIPTPQGMKPDALRALGCLIDKGNIEPMYKKGEKIASVRNAFGEVIKDYFSPEDGIVIGKSSNPSNMSGGRIIHLGILK